MPLPHITRQTQYHIAEVVLLVVAMVSGALLITGLLDPFRDSVALFSAGLLFTGCLLISIRLWLDPVRIRAANTQAMLNLASETLEAMSDGLNETSAQQICDLLLPASSAIAVAITDRNVILGYAGSDSALNQTGSPIRTAATHATLLDGKMRVMHSVGEIGFPSKPQSIRAGIIAPLVFGNRPVGTLKFYYPSARRINDAQQSIAAGFAELLSTQMAAGALEQQKKLATSMELKALQSQINPHFLFNTINTIASFIRTDPAKARVLLREFATFYRRTLEDASDLIMLSREVEQTERYLQFETARFGEDRLSIESDIPDELAGLLVPAFMVQPLVENSVKHAMPMTGKLVIRVSAHAADGDDLHVVVADDGVGMTEDQRLNIMNAHAESDNNLGIAVNNINERIKGYYDEGSRMEVTSAPGEGTTITLVLKGGLIQSNPPIDLSQPGALYSEDGSEE